MDDTTTTGRTRGDRFLDAYAAIERLLRDASGADRGVSFSALVKTAAESNPAVRRYRGDLQEYGDLRNAIVHERTDGRLIAEPHELTVQRLETICDVLTKPPLLTTVCTGGVQTIAPEAPVGEAARTMRAGDFSQMPVHDGESVVGLLAAETIARWLGVMFDHHGGIVEDVPVAEVLEHTEDPAHHCQFVDRNAPVFDALDLFDRHHTQGWPLDAILVTHSGTAANKPLAIVTSTDIPKLFVAAGRPAKS